VIWNPGLIAEKLPGDRFRDIRDAVLTYTVPQTVAAIGDERLAWLRALPLRWAGDDLTVIHAGPNDAWHTVPDTATDEEMAGAFGGLGIPRIIYGHIHVPFVRRLPRLMVVNSGAVSLSFDGDPRASYAIVEGSEVTIRRVAYDVEKEIDLLTRSADPLKESTIATLRTGRYVPMEAAGNYAVDAPG
jgi:diadenosine tetraphosphatase ApaH/serine/threonine PP2A family protein phosphatase